MAMSSALKASSQRLTEPLRRATDNGIDRCDAPCSGICLCRSRAERWRSDGPGPARLTDTSLRRTISDVPSLTSITRVVSKYNYVENSSWLAYMASVAGGRGIRKVRANGDLENRSVQPDVPTRE